MAGTGATATQAGVADPVFDTPVAPIPVGEGEMERESVAALPPSPDLTHVVVGAGGPLIPLKAASDAKTPPGAPSLESKEAMLATIAAVEGIISTLATFGKDIPQQALQTDYQTAITARAKIEALP